MENTNKEIPQGSNNAGNALTWLEKILLLESKYGLKSIINGFLILFIAIMMGMIAFNPSFIFSQIEKIQTQKHEQMLATRKSVDPLTKSQLVSLRGDLSADRCFLFETHNGGSNLNGLPFLYIDMTYDEPRNGLLRIQDEYKNINQNRYDFINFIYENNFWYGNVEEIKSIDIELYYRLQKVGITHLGIIMIYGESLPAGMVGVALNIKDDETVPSYGYVKQKMYQTASQLVILLDKYTKN